MQNFHIYRKDMHAQRKKKVVNFIKTDDDTLSGSQASFTEG
jgi:hypothetical protein